MEEDYDPDEELRDAERAWSAMENRMLWWTERIEKLAMESEATFDAWDEWDQSPCAMIAALAYLLRRNELLADGGRGNVLADESEALLLAAQQTMNSALHMYYRARAAGIDRCNKDWADQRRAQGGASEVAE